MKNLRNQSPITELIENTVSHIPKFFWNSSEGKNLKLLECEEEGQRLIFPKFQFFPVENNNMKSLGNQPPITELIENTVSHIPKFSWKTSERKNLKLLASEE
ncbi:unnamed protein product [Ceutorhynchus assimilis]|uniref:Uncharacterized protein n=1 Tax=Ceutorhynchus assimilis TaxID=467358 RepID=A0A9N9QSP6_9CUCU|nr:unnamed protein product [Ceutorhynchus assimilis]